jgi:ABC-type spermidine/putrescine transport system permease subunit II
MNFGYLILFIGLECLLSFALAWWLVRRSKHMSRRKLLLIAPLPVPALIFALGIYVIVNVSSLSREECGVDACGFAIAGIIVA